VTPTKGERGVAKGKSEGGKVPWKLCNKAGKLGEEKGEVLPVGKGKETESLKKKNQRGRSSFRRRRKRLRHT